MLPWSKGSSKQKASEPNVVEEDPVVSFNVGGELFTTKASTLKRAGPRSILSLLADALIEQHNERKKEPSPSPRTTPQSRPKSWFRSTTTTKSGRFSKDSDVVSSFDLVLDGDGNIFLDREPGPMRFILKYLRALGEGTGQPTMQKLRGPMTGTSEYIDVLEECRYYGVEDLENILLAQGKEDQIENPMVTVHTATVALATATQEHPPYTKREMSESTVSSASQYSRVLQAPVKVKDLQEEQLAKLRYNLLVVGVTGTGKSSSLNTLLGQEMCTVSGAQAQGTRGCVLQEGVVVAENSENFVSFIDTQGLGADISITDVALLSNIMEATDKIATLGIINNVLISYDLTTRATAAAMANQLTLTELFAEMQKSCFLMFTKWNTTGVQMEWNTPLRTWIRKWRKAKTMEEISEEPPSYTELFQAYCAYVVQSMALENDAGAFSKCASFMAFFNARVIWMYNLDSLLVEDMMQGELPAYEEYLYKFYRQKSLEVLELGSTEVNIKDLSFLHKKPEHMKKIATDLIKRRDEKIALHEVAGKDPEKTEAVRVTFIDMANETAQRIGLQNFDEAVTYSHKLAQIVGVAHTVAKVGCVVQ